MKEKMISLVRSLKRVPRILREILFGKAIHEIDLELRKERVSLFDLRQG